MILGICGSGRKEGNTGALVEEVLTEEQAKESIFLLDSRGVIYEGREGVDEYKKPFARDAAFAKGWDLNAGEGVSLEELINNVGITVLLGPARVGQGYF